MAYEVTATRKRPQQFGSLAGQEFVVSTITNAIKQNRIAHAYLFSGPRGVGKTTTARLLAKALNCENGPTAEPCNTCSNCQEITKGINTDVIEIDGASNTSVNDIRNIKDEISFPPQHSKYKIYIIDEVHMLSTSAFNALLKTIEEPPEYCIFIFATTETQKVPATIRSRCQQFNFQLLNLETIKELLAEAAKESNCTATDEALFWIAKESTGSMRDAYTLFDQVLSFSDGEMTLQKIKQKLGLSGIDSINQVMLHVVQDEKDLAIKTILDLLQRGVSIEQIIKDLCEYFRNLLLINKGITSESILGEQLSSFPKEVISLYNSEQLESAFQMFLQLYRDIRYSLNPRFELELAVSKLSTLRYLASNVVLMEQIARLKNDLINGKITPTNEALKSFQSVQPKAVTVNTVKPVVEKEATVIKESPKNEEVVEIQEKKTVDEPEKKEEKVEVAPKPIKTELTLEDYNQCLLFAKQNDSTLATTLSHISNFEFKNGYAILNVGSSFTFNTINRQIEEIGALFEKAVGYRGPIRANILQTQQQQQQIEENEILPELDRMIVEQLGGVRE